MHRTWATLNIGLLPPRTGWGQTPNDVVSDTTCAGHSPKSQTLESGRSPVQGGGLIPSLVRDPCKQSASEIDDAGAELGRDKKATKEQ